MAPKLCVWRRLGVRHKRLGVVKGVGRRASPQRLKNHALYSTIENHYCHGLKLKVTFGSMAHIDIDRAMLMQL